MIFKLRRTEWKEHKYGWKKWELHTKSCLGNLKEWDRLENVVLPKRICSMSFLLLLLSVIFVFRCIQSAIMFWNWLYSYEIYFNVISSTFVVWILRGIFTNDKVPKLITCTILHTGRRLYSTQRSWLDQPQTFQLWNSC
jgi:hypothetical protein